MKGITRAGKIIGDEVEEDSVSLSCRWIALANVLRGFSAEICRLGCSAFVGLIKGLQKLQLELCASLVEIRNVRKHAKI